MFFFMSAWRLSGVTEIKQSSIFLMTPDNDRIASLSVSAAEAAEKDGLSFEINTSYKSVILVVVTPKVLTTGSTSSAGKAKEEQQLEMALWIYDSRSGAVK